MLPKDFDKNDLDFLLSELAKSLKKKLGKKRVTYELVIVGGASILLNYNFRLSTVDIDCIDVNNALLKETINEIADKYSLRSDWINTEFLNTDSYSPKLVRFSSFYKSFNNNILSIRTIKDEYLVAMKLKSGRKYKHDYSDIYGIIKSNRSITYDSVINAFVDLYGDIHSANLDALNFLKHVILDEATSYKATIEQEIDNKATLLKHIKDVKNNEESIDDILKKIK